MNLEKEFEELSRMANDYIGVMQQVEGATFDNIGFIKKFRYIQMELRKEMMRQGIADTSQQCRLPDEIRAVALELDTAIIRHAMLSNYVEQYNVAQQLYDLLVQYTPEPEKAFEDDEPASEEEDVGDEEPEPQPKKQLPPVPPPPPMKKKPGRPPKKADAEPEPEQVEEEEDDE